MKYVFSRFAVLCICGCFLPTTFVSPFELHSETVFDAKSSRFLQNPIEYIDDILCCWRPDYDDAVGCTFAQASENNSNNFPLDPYAILYGYRFMIGLSVLGCCLCATVLWLVFRGLAKMIKKKVG